LTGQLTIKWAEQYINQYLNTIWKTSNVDYVLYSDTDSLYLNFAPFIDKFNPSSSVNFLDKISKDKINPIIDQGYHELFNVMGGFSQKMNMKREKICNKALWTGKKHYILSVLDNEGVRYEKPKLSIIGIEAIKSSTPALIRSKLKEIFEIIFQKDQVTVKDYIETVRKEFFQSSPELIAFPRGISFVEKWVDNTSEKGYIKGTPIHARAAVLYNRLVKEKNLQNKHYYLHNGDNLLYLYLKTPNPIRENIIGFSDILPKEFELHPYIDYETQFQKTFLDVIEPIMKKIGWNINPNVETLSDFYE
jgi:hypothetical protein